MYINSVDIYGVPMMCQASCQGLGYSDVKCAHRLTEFIEVQLEYQTLNNKHICNYKLG